MSVHSSCPSCGCLIPSKAGPTHAYMSPNAECWAMYGEVLAREYSDPAYWQSHRLLTDAYCAQHSPGADPRARQSVNIHLAGLMMHFEDGVEETTVIAFLKRAAERTDFPALAMPEPDGNVTITEIWQAKTADEHAAAVEIYARRVFDNLAAHHAKARQLIDEVFQ